MSDSLKDLQRQIAKLNESMSRLAGDQEAIQFGKYAQEYLRQKLLNPTLRRSTKRSFQNQVTHHLVPAFGSLEMGKITNLVFLQWVMDKRQDDPGFRFFNARKSLIEILNAAKNEGQLDRIPKLDNPDQPRSVGRVLEDREVLRLLRRTKQRLFRFFFYTLWKMGCRPREILQWEWSMIAWDEPGHTWISIPARISKTDRNRRIPINPNVSKRLWKRWQKGPFSKYVFPKIEGPNLPCLPQLEYHGAWRTACKKAGIKAMPYDMRRTFITKAMVDGKRPVYVAQFLDTSVKMIEKVYTKEDIATMEDISK